MSIFTYNRLFVRLMDRPRNRNQLQVYKTNGIEKNADENWQKISNQSNLPNELNCYCFQYWHFQMLMKINEKFKKTYTKIFRQKPIDGVCDSNIQTFKNNWNRIESCFDLI